MRARNVESGQVNFPRHPERTTAPGRPSRHDPGDGEFLCAACGRTVETVGIAAMSITRTTMTAWCGRCRCGQALPRENR
jgi:hypothetical protein